MEQPSAFLSHFEAGEDLDKTKDYEDQPPAADKFVGWAQPIPSDACFSATVCRQCDEEETYHNMFHELRKADDCT